MASSWGYCCHNGPATWSNNIPAAGGKRQSPIDIQPKDAKYDDQLAKAPLRMSHDAGSAKDLINTGHSVQVTYDLAGSCLEGGPLSNKYQLAQFHFHWGKSSDKGSEHTIDGKTFAAEAHLVHVNIEKYKTFEEAVKHPDGLCVLGAFFKVGKEHEGLKKLTSNFSKVNNKDQRIPIGSFDPECLLPDDRNRYWTYPGSLTTPPCLECVTWIVFKHTVEVSEAQMETFRALKSLKEGEAVASNDELKGQIIDNYRPPCPINDRALRASFEG